MMTKPAFAAAFLVSTALVALPAPEPAWEQPVEAREHQNTTQQQQQQQQQQKQQPDTLVLTLGTTAKQPRVGVQDFIVPSGDAELLEAARTVAEVLWADLDFEKEFYMIDRKASAMIPSSPTPQTVPLEPWRELGADFVVHGTLRRAQAGEFEVDIRIVIVHGQTAGQLDYDSTFARCTAKNPRWCAHSIADEIHEKKRNLQGVARTKIAFTSDRDNRAGPGRQVKEIYVMDYDGANQRRVTAHNSLSMQPVWAPDGVSIAYVSYFQGFNDIYMTRPDGRAAIRPARGNPDARNFSPAISPDGTRMLFQSSRGNDTGNADIFIVNIDGTGLRNLTPGTPNSSEGVPGWNPAGTEIVFTSNRTGTNQLYVMTAEGLSLRRLPADRWSDKPTWSLQNFIAFTYGPSSGPHDIAIYDLLTNRISLLTEGVGTNGSPAVSPNGRHIVFSTDRWGGTELGVISRRGGAPKRLTEAGNNSYPNWSRSPSSR
jgi:TolB protein